MISDYVLMHEEITLSANQIQVPVEGAQIRPDWLFKTSSLSLR